MHRCTLERFAAKHGALPFRLLDKHGIERVLKPLGPGAARNMRNVLRRMMKWSVAERIISSDPTAGVIVTMPRSEGWHTMTEAEREQYCAHHPDWHESQSRF